METFTIILLVLTLVSVLFLLFMRYKVNKIKKEEEELINKINTFSHVVLESKNNRNFSSKRSDKDSLKKTNNFNYIGGIDPIDDEYSRVIITSSSDIYDSDGFGNGGSFGGGGASGSWGDSSDSSSSSSDSSDSSDSSSSD